MGGYIVIIYFTGRHLLLLAPSKLQSSPCRNPHSLSTISTCFCYGCGNPNPPADLISELYWHYWHNPKMFVKPQKVRLMKWALGKMRSAWKPQDAARHCRLPQKCRTPDEKC